jgi:hypothetical protein
MSASAAKVLPFRPAPEQDGRGRFVKGNTGGGRSKGSRNKLGDDFLISLYDDFADNGKAAIQKMRETDPTGYLCMIARLIPREAGTTDEMSPVELMSEGALVERTVETFGRMNELGLFTDDERARLLNALGPKRLPASVR